MKHGFWHLRLPLWVRSRKLLPSYPHRRVCLRGSSLIGTLVGIAILTLTFAGGFLALETDGTATAVQSAQVQATTVANSILNLEQANPGCGNYTAMGANTTGSSLNLGALSTWGTWSWGPGPITMGSGNGDFSISGGTLTYIGTGAQSPNGGFYSQTINVTPGATYSFSADMNATYVSNSSPYGPPGISIYDPVSYATYFEPVATPGQSGLVSGTWTDPAGLTQVMVTYYLKGAIVAAGEPLTWSNIQLSIVGTMSGVTSQFMPCQIAVPAGEYRQNPSDTAQPQLQNLSSCGSAPAATTLNLEQASPSPWFCVNYSGVVLWGYAESSWVIPSVDASVCPGSAESGAVPLASLLQRTVVLKSQVLNQPVQTYTLSRTTSPSVGPLPMGETSNSGLRSVMITGVPQGDFVEIAMTVWTGGTGGATQNQMLLTGSPNSQGQIFFPAIPADATQLEYWITATPSLQNPPSAASGIAIPSLANTVTCEAG